jgi:2-succinyl-6-hydroxy-2,4-cyclohexadiene-1-carboxylate synthase
MMSRRVRVRDICLNVTVAGNGEPLVLLHGFTGSAAQWANCTTRLVHDFRTIAVDLIGHGQSDAPADPQRYRIDACVADLAALLDHLGVECAGWLGYSMGARVALAFALTHPRRVRALLLEGVAPGIANPAERQARIASDSALAARIERDGVEAFVDFWMQQPLFASQARLGAAALAAARAARCRNSALGLANSLRGMGTGLQKPLWERLGELTVPTLLLVGELDSKFRAIAQEMLARIRGARIAIVPGAGHAAHVENPAAFQDEVLQFLAAHTARDAAAPLAERVG